MPQAIPGVSSSSPPATARAAAQPMWTSGTRLDGSGSSLLRVVSPAQLDEQDRARMAAASERNRPVSQLQDDLGSYIRQRWMTFRNHRNQGNDPLNFRLLRSQRMFEGKYDPEKLSEIKKFGGSEVYARLVAVKCRGATSLLRDVYLGAERPWDIQSQPDPDVPPDIQASIAQLLASEVMGQRQAGEPVLPAQVHSRYTELMHAAQQAARRTAQQQADSAADKIEDILREGGFFEAMAEFLVDLPLFPFACIKGPTVRMLPKLQWVGTVPVTTLQPRLCWERVNPFNLYWSPGVSNILDAEIIERKRLTRTDLNDLLGLPGYDEEAVRGALGDYARGLREWMDWTDMEEALNEGRESPDFNQSHMIDAIEYSGNIQGHMLIDQGVDPRKVPDPDRDYMVQSWVVGRHVLKTQINPSPRQRHPYYITSYEKVPGTVHGHSLPDILEDLQEIANATLRALVNNMGIASGPQVVVNTDMLSPTENEDELYPWKRWKVASDGMGATPTPPVSFFQPQSNSQELLAVYQATNNLADDISALPRYITGEGLNGGAGRTASGLSMLMGNAQKVLQTVAANVDNDVLEPLLQGLYDMIMLTDTTGLLSGKEQITVNGVSVALQKDTERQKQLQFLQITANPLDAQIVGPVGRGRVLRSVAQGLGLPDDIVPTDTEIQQKQQAQERAAAMMAQMQAQAKQAKPGASGGAGAAGGGQGGPPDAAAQAQGAQAPSPTPAQLSDSAPAVNSQAAPPGVSNG